MLLLAMLDGLLWGLHMVSTVFLLLFCLNGYWMIVLHHRARHRMLQRDAAVWQTWHADTQSGLASRCRSRSTTSPMSSSGSLTW